MSSRIRDRLRRGIFARPITPAPPPDEVSEVVSLEILGPENLDPSAVADAGLGKGINPNGYMVRLVTPWREGETLLPVMVEIDVERPGFDQAGNAVTRTYTHYGTVLARRQKNGSGSELLKLASHVGANLEAIFALNEAVRAVDTIVEARVLAGFYGAAVHGTIANLTNSSTRPYFKPLYKQLARPGICAGAVHRIEVMAAHNAGRDGKMIACAKIAARDSQVVPNVTPVTTVIAPAISQLAPTYVGDATGKLGKPEVWGADLATDNLTQGDTCKPWIRLYPWDGDASAVWDSDTDAAAWPTTDHWTVLPFVCDRTAGYGGMYGYVKADAAGPGVCSTDPAVARASPFPTVDHATTGALVALQAAQAARGHNDVGGTIVRFMETTPGAGADHTIAASMNTRTVGIGECRFEVDPLATGAVRIMSTASRTLPPNNMYIDVPTVKNSTVAVWSGGGVASSCITVGPSAVDIWNGATTTWLNTWAMSIQWGTRYLNTTAFAYGVQVPALAANGSNNYGCILALMVDNGTDRGMDANVYALIGFRGKLSALRDPVAAQPSNDGGFVWSNRLMKIATLLQIGGSRSYARGFARCNNVFEALGSFSFSIGADGQVPDLHNIIDWNNTAPHDVAGHNVEAGRFNGPYVDVAAAVNKQVWDYCQGLPLTPRLGFKTDTFDFVAQGSGRTGNHERQYGVGCHGLGLMILRNPDPVTGNEWTGMWWDQFSASNLGAIAFVNNQAGAGQPGGGTYNPVAPGAGAVIAGAPMSLNKLSFDADGNPRTAVVRGALMPV